LSFTLLSFASPQTVSKNASVLSAGRVCQLTRPRLRGPHLVRDAGRYDQDLALSERSVLPAHQDVEPAGEDLEAFLLAGVMVDGRPRGGRLRVDGLHLQQFPAGVLGRLAEDQPLAAYRVLQDSACVDQRFTPCTA
jgi:hypothetical protein